MKQLTRAASRSHSAHDWVDNMSPEEPQQKAEMGKQKLPHNTKCQAVLSGAMFDDLQNEKMKLVACNQELRTSLREKNRLLQTSKLELEDSQRNFRLVIRGLRQQLKSTKFAMGNLQQHLQLEIDDLKKQLLSSQLALDYSEQCLRPDTEDSERSHQTE
ncbi:uncharacterized protein N7469_001971 [Penicillium citrinum]|uniref:Uncharacterized protein n=1 Tax=Penicillium citrinum TaxID=5077 RepID=A0A9W9P9L8_PENCI|nr:uncharacterized protein N7469_001971 [Penicillium citrinum]KAJ5240380.1 hypothetical protein N7469_001971 [Penicillium citrinum]